MTHNETHEAFVSDLIGLAASKYGEALATVKTGTLDLDKLKKALADLDAATLLMEDAFTHMRAAGVALDEADRAEDTLAMVASQWALLSQSIAEIEMVNAMREINRPKPEPSPWASPWPWLSMAIILVGILTAII